MHGSARSLQRYHVGSSDSGAGISGAYSETEQAFARLTSTASRSDLVVRISPDYLSTTSEKLPSTVTPVLPASHTFTFASKVVSEAKKANP